MKLNENLFARFCCFALIAMAVWFVVTASAQTDTNVVIVEAKPGEVQAVTTVFEEPSTVLTFGLDKLEPLQRLVLGIPLWQYLASALYLLLAILVAKIFDYIVSVQLKKITSRTKLQWDDYLIELLRGPVRMLVIVLLLQFGLNLFDWPDWLKAWLRKGFYLLVAFSFTYLAVKLVDVMAKYWKGRPSIASNRTFSELLIPLISKTIKAFVLTMAIMITLDNLGFNIRTLLAGASISGLALGLAAQDTVANLFGAAAVFVDQPFKIGDRIQLNGIDGTVEEIGLRSTRVRNLDGHLITVPNKTMGNATITNISRRPNIKTVMNIGITYDTSADQVNKAVEIIKEVYGGHPMTHDLITGFNNYADSSLNILVIHFWKGLDFKAYLAGLQELNVGLKRRFDQEGINFAFPSRTVYLKQDSDWRMQLPNGKADAQIERSA